MSLEKSDAIILRVYPWSETSCVASIYTREFGKLSMLAKGARRSKSPFEAALDLLSICRVVFIAKSADALDILTEAKLQRRFRAGQKQLLRLYCGYYVAELLDRLTDKGDRQPEIYDLSLETLMALEDLQLEPRAIILRFELGLLRMTGNLPSLRQCVQCGKDVSESDGGGRWLIFGALAGGVLCSTCQAGSRQMLRMPVEVRQWMERFSDPDWRAIDVQNYILQDRAALRGLMGRYWTALLDRKLQLHAFLEELGR